MANKFYFILFDLIYLFVFIYLLHRSSITYYKNLEHKHKHKTHKSH